MKYDLKCEVTAAENSAGMTVRGVLRRQCGVSTRLIRRIIHGNGIHGAPYPVGGEGGVYVNDVSARFGDKVKTGDVIGLVYPEERSWLEAQDIPVEIIYEDDDILVINKQPGIVVHPTKGHQSGTIANGIVKHMADIAESYHPRFVNRLDMDTSGVLLIGKNPHAQSDFASQAEKGMIRKVYNAVVCGIVTADSGTIDLPIGLEAEGSPRRAVREDGYPSVTHYKVLERFDGVEHFDGGFSFLEIEIETGRTHQIRVHMAHIGHPVVGDSLYGDAPDFHSTPDGNNGEEHIGAIGAVEGDLPPVRIERQALHAASLAFRHPNSGNRMVFEAPLPEDITACLASLRRE